LGDILRPTEFTHGKGYSNTTEDFTIDSNGAGCRLVSYRRTKYMKIPLVASEARDVLRSGNCTK
jgi:hypothetical protein